jgi:hypothetical protein
MRSRKERESGVWYFQIYEGVQQTQW